MDYSITKKDVEVLHQIYKLRCLSLGQLYDGFYKNDYKGIEQFRDTKLKELISAELIEAESNRNTLIYFLTRRGVDLVVSEYKKPLNIIDENTGRIKRGYHTASELKMTNKLMQHQICLNQFVLDFQKLYLLQEYNAEWEYYDEKYLSQYISIRPDGMIRILDMDLFLEMDMSTESTTQINEKWIRYSTFLHSPEYRSSNQNVLVLFIIDGTNNTENRKRVIEQSLTEILFGELSSTFDILIGTRNEILLSLFSMILPDLFQSNSKKAELFRLLQNNHGFTISDTDYFYKYINRWNYGFYIRKLDRSNKIIKEHGKIQGYFIDYYIDDKMSTFLKLNNFDMNLAVFDSHYGWKPNYIIVCDDIEKFMRVYRLMKVADYNYNSYVTTISRLDELEFDEAIIPIQSLQ